MKNSKSEYDYLNKQNDKALRAANQMDEVHSEKIVGWGCAIVCIIILTLAFYAVWLII